LEISAEIGSTCEETVNGKTEFIFRAKIPLKPFIENSVCIGLQTLVNFLYENKTPLLHLPSFSSFSPSNFFAKVHRVL